MNMEQDPLTLMKSEKWNELQNESEKDYPRGITVYNVLQTQQKWLEQGIDYGCKVFCPYGEAKNGIIALLSEQAIDRFLIECPTDDTSKLEEALKKTRNINWDREFSILFTPFHVVECVRRVVNDIGKEITHIIPLISYFLDRNTPLFDVNPPQGFTFQLLSQNHVELVESKWPYRYPGSAFYFDLLIQAQAGYGVFQDQELISFCFIKDTGALCHLYTLEDHRGKGYGIICFKMLCNILLNEDRHVNSYCLKKNVSACKIHEKCGFKVIGEVYTVQKQ